MIILEICFQALQPGLRAGGCLLQLQRIPGQRSSVPVPQQLRDARREGCSRSSSLLPAVPLCSPRDIQGFLSAWLGVGEIPPEEDGSGGAALPPGVSEGSNLSSGLPREGELQHLTVQHRGAGCPTWSRRCSDLRGAGPRSAPWSCVCFQI